MECFSVIYARFYKTDAYKAVKSLVLRGKVLKCTALDTGSIIQNIIQNLKIDEPKQPKTAPSL